MAQECPLNRKPRSFRRWLILLLLLLMGLSVPFGAYWFMESTERRIRTTERMLMEELALLRAEVAALSHEQSASQEAVEQLAVRTEALLDLWQLQLDKLVAIESGGSEGFTLSVVDEGETSATESVSLSAITEDELDEVNEDRNAPFWVAWWAGAAYYAMKAGQYLPTLYQFARLHPAIP